MQQFGPSRNSPKPNQVDCWPIRVHGDDFSDLAPLREAVSEKRIVQLGESIHGASEFYSIKCRIVQFLHQQCGFDVIAFESGLFECCYQNLRPWATAEEALKNTLFGNLRCEEILPLFEYIKNSRETARPLHIAGFDCQISAPQTFSARRDFFRERVGAASLLKSEHFELLDRSVVTTIDRVAYDSIRDPTEGSDLRDLSMADSLSWIADTLYPDSKIIVWAHNAHVAKTAPKIIKPTINSPYSPKVTMGSHLHRKYGEQMHTIGLYAYSGEVAYNDNKVWPLVEDHTGDSLEARLSSPVYENCFVDLQKRVSNQPEIWGKEMKSRNPGMEVQLLLPLDCYDSIVFVRNVHGHKRIK